jgi:hypothetical protein
MSAKYRIGNLVEFSQSSYQNDEEYQDLDVSKRYAEGESGYILDVKEGDDGFVYKIQVGMTNIIDVPESHIFDPNSSVRSKVEERLREKQETKTFRDTEGRIGGSKKEKAAWRLVAGQVYTLSDLDKIEEADEKLAIELIKKDTVYPKLDVASQRENGVNSGAVFLKVKLRESYPSKVPTKSAQRKIYVGFAEYLFKKTLDILTTNDFINFVSTTLLEETITEYIKILKPNLLESIESLKQENKRLLDQTKIDLNRLETDKKNETERLGLKYPELILSYYPYFDFNSLPEHDRGRIVGLRNEIRELQSEREKYERSFSSIEKEFLDQLSSNRIPNSYDRKSVARILLKEIFGSTFINFVTRGSEAAIKNYELANDYDALSKVESEILIAEKSDYYLKNLQDKEAQIEKINSLVSELEYDDFFQNRGSTGYHQSIFGESYKGKGKWYYYADLKSKEYKRIYANRYASKLQQSINEIKNDLEQIKNKYRERDNNWSWFSSEKSPTGKQKSKDKIKVNTYPPLLHVKRTGGYLITEDNLTPVTVEKDGVKFNEYPILKNNFGFKEIEFGQSLKDREAKEHVKHFLGAIADLGDILDLNIKKLNQLGGLSISFASRGSGKATATYTALRRIINITKTRGGGAVAHEYLHYIDNIIPSINRSGYEHNQWASVKDSTQKRWYGSRVIRNISNEDVSKSVTNIFNYIDERLFPNENGGSSEIGNRPIIKKTVQAYKGNNRWNIPDAFMSNNQWIKPTEIDEYFRYFKERYNQYKFIEKIKKKDIEILGTIVSRFGLEEHEFEFETKTSQFLANSIKAGDYWSREWELFARSFETYVYDKLAKANRANTYLVAGFYFGEEYGVYPIGEEREKLFILFDKFIDAIKTAYDLSGFIPWTNERVDEYFAVDEETDEESGIVVDDETGEVLEEVGEANPVKSKLRELLEMLNDSKMELGGEVQNGNYFDKLNDYLITL